MSLRLLWWSRSQVIAHAQLVETAGLGTLTRITVVLNVILVVKQLPRGRGRDRGVYIIIIINTNTSWLVVQPAAWGPG